MSDLEYDIQKLAELSAVPRRTIYFYTQQGIIPPPHGAGLGARYGEIHLLRLRLIPHLRRQGLRLDEIRQRLDGMDLAAMRQRLAEAPQPFTLPPALPLPGRVTEVARSTFIHYQLPGGCTLIVPGGLDAEMQRKIDQLLVDANQILTEEKHA